MHQLPCNMLPVALDRNAEMVYPAWMLRILPVYRSGEDDKKRYFRSIRELT